MNNTPSPIALDHVLSWLRCPVCQDEIARVGRRVTCDAGHSYDIAKQGYVNLGVSGKDARADTTAMVQARERVHEAGVFTALREALSAELYDSGVGDHAGLLDLAGGTGRYSEHAVMAGDQRGYHLQALVCDLSVPALKHAAKLHSRIATLATDLTKPLPLRDRSVDAILNVFGPRNAQEMLRVLRPGGMCVTVTPTARHFAELIEPLRMLRVGEDKHARLLQAMHGFTPERRTLVEHEGSLTSATAADIVRMGPSAHHVDEAALESSAARLAAQSGNTTVPVTLSCEVQVFRAPAVKSIV